MQVFRSFRAFRGAARTRLPGLSVLLQRSQPCGAFFATTVDDRQLAINAAIKQIEHSFGKGSIMKMNSNIVAQVPSLSTGILSLDCSLGIGGLPLGRIVEIYGPESSGKTTLALMVIASAQKNNMKCTFIDAGRHSFPDVLEHALDPLYASSLGVKLEELYISQPDSGEQALNITDILVRSGGMGVVVIDSVAALVPKVEVDGEMGDQHMALQARMMSQALRKLAGSLSKTQTLLIFINQIRLKVGLVFGNPEVTPGGNALKFFSSVRMDIRRKSPIKREDEVIGYSTSVKVVKNKVAPPFRECLFDLYFKGGVNRCGEVVDLALKYGLLTKSGAWYSNPRSGERVAQGREKCKQYYDQHPSELKELEALVLSHSRELVTGEPAAAAEEPAEAAEGVPESPPAVAAS